jgi:cytoskeletal protein RodZ
MQCAHTEKLIPLYVGQDLPADEAEAIRRHLETCGHCRNLATEFEDSRVWLSAFSAPEFDEATLEGMRDAVLSEIGRIEQRKGWSQWFIPGWNLRFAAAVAVAVLIAIFAFYDRRGEPSQTFPAQEKIANKDQNKRQQGTGDPNSDNVAVNPSPLPFQPAPQKHRRERIEKRRPVELPAQRNETVAFVPAPINIEPAVEPPAGAPGTNSDVAVTREMTRIEFQTADPNIRIIWLTPKDSNTSNTKPNTNAR